MAAVFRYRSTKGRSRVVVAAPPGSIEALKDKPKVVPVTPRSALTRQWSSRSKKLMQASLEEVTRLQEEVEVLTEQVKSMKHLHKEHKSSVANQFSKFQESVEIRCAVHLLVSGVSFLVFNSSLQQHAKTLVAAIVISGGAFVFLRFYLGLSTPFDGRTAYHKVIGYRKHLKGKRHHHHHHHEKSTKGNPRIEHTKEDLQGMQFNFLQDSGIAFEPVLEQLSKEEQEKFKSFKAAYSLQAENDETFDHKKPHIHPDDFNLLRFLKADKFDSDLALKRLLATIAWRQKNRIDDLPENPPACLDYYKRCRVKHYVGHDPKGRPLVVESIGKFFSNPEIPRSLKMSEWLKCYAYDMSELFNELRKSSIREGKAIQEVCFIGDLQGLKFYQMYKKLKFMRLLTREVDVHFPEIAGVVFLINAPSFVAKIWTMIQHWLDPCLASKIRIHSGVPLDEMVKAFGAKVIPEEYGGLNVGSMKRTKQ